VDTEADKVVYKPEGSFLLVKHSMKESIQEIRGGLSLGGHCSVKFN
jgi:hypothetical protein